MNCEAVIFDLFGTLVDSFTVEEYDATVKKTAEALRVSHEVFKVAWQEDSYNRNVGVYRTTTAMMRALSQKLGIDPDEDMIATAVTVRFDFMRQVMVPRSDALDVLAKLKKAGIRIALISNCSPVTEVLWKETPFPPYFDVTVFSSAVGFKKPDIRIYQLALEGLRVDPGACIYVGDGDGNELTGALEAGLNPVMITVPSETSARFDSGKQEWNGPVIGSLTEILAMVGIDREKKE